MVNLFAPQDAAVLLKGPYRVLGRSYEKIFKYTSF